MPWFKVDDKLHSHRKTRKALRGVRRKRRDAGAMGLWVLAGTWCADNLTDGFVPADELAQWDDDGEALAARLVDAGLWVPEEHDGEPGFRFHDWPDRQPTRAQVELQRSSARERMRRVRQNKSERAEDVRANGDGTSDEVRSTPSRPGPDPSPVSQSTSTLTKGAGPGGLTDDDLTKIQLRLRCDRPHAAAVADQILTRAGATVASPLRYVLAGIDSEPDRYKPSARNPRTGDVRCPVSGHSDPADACRQCASEAKAAGS